MIWFSTTIKRLHIRRQVIEGPLLTVFILEEQGEKKKLNPLFLVFNEGHGNTVQISLTVLGDTAATAEIENVRRDQNHPHGVTNIDEKITYPFLSFSKTPIFSKDWRTLRFTEAEPSTWWEGRVPRLTRPPWTLHKAPTPTLLRM